MALHRVSSFTFQVPNVDEVISYYEEFGLTNNGDGSMSTLDGGRQLYVEEGTPGAFRRISTVTLGADDPDDLGRIASNLTGLDIDYSLDGDRLVSRDPATHTEVVIVVEARIQQAKAEAASYNGPWNTLRVNRRAAGVATNDKVRPRKLGHVVIGTTDSETSQRFFIDGIGFKVSDRAGVGAFLRCSSDHHNLLLMGAPMTFPHHTSWQVEDVDAIGRGAMDLLEDHPERHVWGPGRHYAGSNFFWYLRDPAGTFSEYYSDMDSIVDDSQWTPEAVEGMAGLFRWGPPPSASFLDPEDVAAHMMGAHAS
jgi:catechol 2,3-dioxygenase-like lactoylglutathione lyase family enzyme